MKNLIILLLLIFIGVNAFGQVGINSDATNPDPSAMLDIKSTDKGVLIPRMTSTERNAINGPANGLMVFDTDTGTFWYFDNGIWNEIMTNNRFVTPEETPSHISSLDIGLFPREIKIQGRFAYLISENAPHFQIIDIAASFQSG